jgi:hypothetical protein
MDVRFSMGSLDRSPNDLIESVNKLIEGTDKLNKFTKWLLVLTIVIVVSTIVLGILTINHSMELVNSQKQVQKIIEQQNYTQNFQPYVKIRGSDLVIDDDIYVDRPISAKLSVSAIIPHHVHFIIQNITTDLDHIESSCIKISPQATFTGPIEYLMTEGAGNYEFEVPLKLNYSPTQVEKPSSHAGVYLGFGDITYNIDIVDAQDSSVPVQHFQTTSGLTIQKSSFVCGN